MSNIEINKILYERSKSNRILTDNDIVKITGIISNKYDIKHKNLAVNFTDSNNGIATVNLREPILTISSYKIYTDIFEETVKRYGIENAFKYSNAAILFCLMHEMSHLEHYKVIENDNNSFYRDYLGMAYDYQYQINELLDKRNKINNSTLLKLKELKETLDLVKRRSLIDIAEGVADFEGYDKTLKLLHEEPLNIEMTNFIKELFSKQLEAKYYFARNNYNSSSPVKAYFQLLNKSNLIKKYDSAKDITEENKEFLGTFTTLGKLKYGFTLSKEESKDMKETIKQHVLTRY